VPHEAALELLVVLPSAAWEEKPNREICFATCAELQLGQANDCSCE